MEVWLRPHTHSRSIAMTRRADGAAALLSLPTLARSEGRPPPRISLAARPPSIAGTPSSFQRTCALPDLDLQRQRYDDGRHYSGGSR
jgi:hypothetical protein